jgi:membrane fusion protein, multidrug efflux system
VSPARRFWASLRGGHPGSWLSLAALGALLVAGALLWHAHLGRESTDDAFVEGTIGQLGAEIAGRVVEISVSEHQVVAAGEVLVRLDSSDADAKLARARADLAAARNAMVASEAAAASAEAEGKAARVDAWRAGRELERVQNLLKRGAASPQELDAAQAAHEAAQERVRALGLRADAERAALGNEAPVRQAEASVREAELMLARTQLVAPFDAVVGRKNVHLGDIVRPGQALMALRRREPSWIVANFKETQLRGMREGAPAVVRIDAYPDTTWFGHVASFSPASGAKYALIPPEPAAGNFTKVVQRVPVKIVLDELSNGDGRRQAYQDGSEPSLAIGLSAQVSVDVR